MDAQELRNLQEAYMEVYSIDEGLGSAIKRVFGGKKSEPEAPKPESRGAELRRRYNVGPEKSDTSAKRQILDRSRARADRDQERYGDKPFQKQVAQQSKAAHDRYLKAGYSKYGADLPVSGGQGGSGGSGRGSKAARRAAALQREEYDLYNIILSHLLDEGYASTEESADKIILNMSESWFEQIVEDYVVVKKDGSREIVKGDPPKPEVKSGGYDYTHTEKQKEEMKKTPKTKIGSRFD